MSEARSKAWKTRREKYGPRGHSGSCRCGVSARSASLMMRYLIRLHIDGVLSEGQVSSATGLDRISVRTLADEYKEGRERMPP